jgi:hypothetical protein
MRLLINAAYDQMAELKEAVARVVSENEKLTERIAELQGHGVAVPEPKQVGPSVYYYVGEKGPYCQVCFDGKGKLVLLPHPHDWNGGPRRTCAVCGKHFYDKAQTTSHPVSPLCSEVSRSSDACLLGLCCGSRFVVPTLAQKTRKNGAPSAE